MQANPGVTTDALRPYRGFSSILQIDNAGSSIYNAMQLNLKRRLSHGLLFGVAYTWSKSLDFGSDQSYQLPDYYNPRIDYGPSDFDIRNTLVVNYVWNIPYGGNLDNRFGALFERSGQGRLLPSPHVRRRGVGHRDVHPHVHGVHRGDGRSELRGSCPARGG